LYGLLQEKGLTNEKAYLQGIYPTILARNES
jgi:hypothetical protein